MERDDALIEWVKERFAERTPPKTIADAHPDYRVTWHEVAKKMLELGYDKDVTGNRVHFGNLWADRKLRIWCNRLIREMGATLLVSKESEISKETRKQNS